ncbi:MAG: aromatic acid exporter family protein [Dehalococcoidia bacterium]
MTLKYRHALKAALAATMAMACVKLLGLPSGFWAPLSALAVLQAQIGASLAASRNYLIASAIGVLVGASIVSVFGDNILIAGAGIFFIVLLTIALRLPPAGASIAAGVVPVMVLAVTGSAWRYGGYRLIDIAIGLGSAIVVSLLLWPSRAVTELRTEVAGAVRDATALATAAIRNLTGTTPHVAADLQASAKGHLEAAQALLVAARQEPLHAAAHALLPMYLPHAELIVEHAGVIDDLARSTLPHDAIVALTPSLNRIAATLDTAGELVASAIETGTAGHPIEAADAATAAMRDAQANLSASNVTALAQGEDLLRLYSLMMAIEYLVREIDRAVQHIEHPDQIVQSVQPAAGAGSASLPRRIDRWWRRVRTSDPSATKRPDTKS